jgi:hypothetical protein
MAHDLGYLVTLVESMPAEVAEWGWLTPWAGGWRYDEEGSPIGRGGLSGLPSTRLNWLAESATTPQRLSGGRAARYVALGQHAPSGTRTRPTGLKVRRSTR